MRFVNTITVCTGIGLATAVVFYLYKRKTNKLPQIEGEQTAEIEEKVENGPNTEDRHEQQKESETDSFTSFSSTSIDSTTTGRTLSSSSSSSVSESGSPKTKLNNTLGFLRFKWWNRNKTDENKQFTTLSEQLSSPVVMTIPQQKLAKEEQEKHVSCVIMNSESVVKDYNSTETQRSRGFVSNFIQRIVGGYHSIVMPNSPNTQVLTDPQRQT